MRAASRFAPCDGFAAAWGNDSTPNFVAREAGDRPSARLFHGLKTWLAASTPRLLHGAKRLTPASQVKKEKPK
jgi:hypothetical protein